MPDTLVFLIVGFHLIPVSNQISWSVVSFFFWTKKNQLGLLQTIDLMSLFFVKILYTVGLL